MKKVLCIALAIALIFLCLCFGASAAKPDLDSNNAATAMVALKSSELRKLYDVAVAEHDLGVLRCTTGQPNILCIYANSSGSLYTYHMLIGYGSVTISDVASTGLTTSITFSGPSYGNYKYQYAWDDSPSGGWIQTAALSNGTLHINCDFVIGYRSTPTSDWIDLTQVVSTVITGNGTLGDVAQSWLDTWNVKLNGLTDNYQSGYVDGYFDGIDEGYDIGYESGRWDAMHDPDLLDPVIEEWFEYGYETGWSEGYREGFTDGFESGVASVPVEPPSEDSHLSYQKGLSDGIGSVSSLSSFLTSVPSGILHAFIEMLDVQLWGIKLYVPFIAIIVLFVVLAIWGIIRRVTGH